MCRIVIFMIGLTAISGCGTLANMQGREYLLMGPTVREPRVYGGVQNHLVRMKEPITRDDSPPSIISDISDYLTYSFVTTFVLIDVPLTIVGDTVTLPFVIAKQHQSESDPAE